MVHINVFLKDEKQINPTNLSLALEIGTPESGHLVPVQKEVTKRQ